MTDSYNDINNPMNNISTSIPSTGSYEMIMKDIKCPYNLKKKISAIWMKNKKNKQQLAKSKQGSFNSYLILKEVITSLEDNNGEDILCDTLYRYLILLYQSNGQRNYIPSSNHCTDHIFNNQINIESNEIWQIIHEMCWNQTTLTTRNGRESIHSCSQQYQIDSNLWNLSIGTHPIIVR